MFKKIFEKIKTFGLFTSKIVNFILLSVVYLTGVFLTSVVGKIFGKKFLDCNKKESSSYWENYEMPKKNLERHYRMF
ncbi:MAG: hypothetical protein KKC26_03645 [Nanoarchaeota archaeon]|nr:hypothetical protein [Nanoarchaeota archaeon]MBU1849626.1 hypothetical protein [Nanoarchaeota archaeon]